MDVEHITENLQSDQRKPARGSGRESDAAKMPRSIFRYVLETSGLHQLFLLLLTVGVFLPEVVPLELQRRIVNDLVKHRSYRLVIILCAVYAPSMPAPSSCRGHQAGPQRLSQLGRRTRNP